MIDHASSKTVDVRRCCTCTLEVHISRSNQQNIDLHDTKLTVMLKSTLPPPSLPKSYPSSSSKSPRSSAKSSSFMSSSSSPFSSSFISSRGKSGFFFDDDFLLLLLFLEDELLLLFLPDDDDDFLELLSEAACLVDLDISLLLVSSYSLSNWTSV